MKTGNESRSISSSVMKKALLIAFVIVGFVLIILGIVQWLSSGLVEGESRISSLKRQIVELGKQIELQVINLQIDKRAKKCLDEKARKLFAIGKVLALLVFSGFCAFFSNNGYGVAESILMVSGLGSFLFLVIPILFVNRVPETNAILELAERKLRAWIYKRHQFDPARIQVRQDDILAKNHELKLLNSELKTLEASDVH